MLIAVIDSRSGPMALASTLGPLVRGVVEGMIGTAVIVSPEADPDTVSIADSSGCRVLAEPNWTDGFARAVTNAQGIGVLVLESGLMMGPDFWPILADTLPVLGNRPAATLPADGGGLWARLGLNRLGGRVSRDSALLLPPSRARKIAQEREDPFRVRYGKECVSLRSAATRVRL
ncbi:MAG TPA: hypothetical protein PLE50_12200 [Rhabdaerophilum sp.]|nr:hypothetical protein [Rhabdaerophilum sp.]